MSDRRIETPSTGVPFTIEGKIEINQYGFIYDHHGIYLNKELLADEKSIFGAFEGRRVRITIEVLDDEGQHAPGHPFDKVREFVKIADAAQRILDREDLSWGDRHDLIFSKQIIKAQDATGIGVPWTDPESDYEHDVLSYTTALIKKANHLRQLIENQ